MLVLAVIVLNVIEKGLLIHIGRQWLLKTISVCIIVFLIVEHWPSPFHFVYTNPAPTVYNWLAHQPGEGLLSIPFFIQDGRKGIGIFNPEIMLMQPVHGKKLVNGYLSRMDDQTWDYFSGSDFFRKLAALHVSDSAETDQSFICENDLRIVRQLPCHWLIVHPHYRNKTIGIQLKIALSKLGCPSFDIDGYQLWQLSPATN